MTKPVCAVVGVGPGNGASFARAMSAKGYTLGLMARSGDFIEALAGELDDATAYRCDVTDGAAVEAAFGKLRDDAGDVDVLLYNAGSGLFGNFDGVEPEALEQSWRVNTMGLFHCAKQAVDAMKKKERGAIIVTGATASLRGGANFAAFAQAKAAQRGLAQSMARQLGPQGIHVALVIVDGVVDMPRTRGLFSDKPDAFFMSPDAIAQAVVHLTEQHPSAWTFELDLRPSVEKW